MQRRKRMQQSSHNHGKLLYKAISKHFIRNERNVAQLIAHNLWDCFVTNHS